MIPRREIFSGREREALLWRPPAESSMKGVEAYLHDFYELAFRSSSSVDAADLSRLSAATQQQQPLRDDEDALKSVSDAFFSPVVFVVVLASEKRE